MACFERARARFSAGVLAYRESVSYQFDSDTGVMCGVRVVLLSVSKLKVR